MMRMAAIFLLTNIACAACLPISEAPKKIGQTVCITGKVIKVGVGKSGTHFLNFCEDYTQCPFAVVVFPRDLHHVGDVRQLEGKTIEVHGKVQKYGGQAEIILRESRQLRGEAAKLPPVPKTYDAERRGGFSAGKFSKPASKSR
jgi:hypothetical protein